MRHQPFRVLLVTWYAFLFLAATAAAPGTPYPVAVFIPLSCVPIQLGQLFNYTLEQVGQDVQHTLPLSLDLSLHVFDSCKEATVMQDVVSVLSPKTDYAAMVGPASTGLCLPTARLASAAQIPMVSWTCTAEDLHNPHELTTFSRTVTHGGAAAHALATMLRHFQWAHVALVSSARPPWPSITSDIHLGLAKQGLKVTEFVSLLSSFNETAITNILTQIDNTMKAIVVLMDTYDKRTFLQSAHAAGLTGGKHVIFFLEFHSSINAASYVSDLLEDEELAQALDAVFVLTGQPAPQIPLAQDKGHPEPSINSTDPLYANHTTPLYPQILADNLYNAVQLLSAALQKTVTSSDGQVPDGAIIAAACRNMTFSGASGKVHVDAQGEMIVYFTLLDYDSKTNSLVAVLEVPNLSSQIVLGASITWPNGKSPPPDLCAFQLCQEEAFDMAILGIAIVVVVILGCLSVAAAYFIRKRRVMKEMEKGPNKILLTAEDLIFVSPKSLSKSSKSFKSQPIFDKPDILKTSQKSLSDNSHQEFTDFSELARYNGDLVYVKELKIKAFEMKSKVLVFLKQMREMRHENINSLVGLFVDPVKCSLVMEYCNRKSLEDIIHNETIKLDWDFKLSLLTDLVRGMKYVHNSPLKVHGNLKSGNCVIDSRWVLKLTDYGLPGLLTKYQSHRDLKTKEMLWTAPELLRDPELCSQGTAKGDVYSFSIIMQEVILRGAPFCMLELDAEEIIKKVRKPPPMCRPSVSQQAAPPQYIQMMKQCWAEMPDMRPDFEQIHQQFKDFNKGKKMNIVDTMFKMLEKYSTDLEDIVRERTLELEDEKKKTENLLSQMLPPSVAQSLLTGKPVEAETFKEVTIYFSDIVGFTTISAMSTPMQVVALLNDLYTTFDSTIDDYDVYKVETIGDAYMVVSGLPVINGNRHAGEVATMALDLLSQCGQFKIQHMPDIPLRLRIGLHTGPCVAGVVGLRMPRYCLFGDTVNTASRMESSGAAFRVHLSGTTKSVLDDLGGYHLHYRGEVELKGKGMHKTYWLVQKDGFTKPLPEPPPLTDGDNHGLASLGLATAVSDDKLNKSVPGEGTDAADPPGADPINQDTATENKQFSSTETLKTSPGSNRTPNTDCNQTDQINNNNNTRTNASVADITQIQPQVDSNKNLPPLRGSRPPPLASEHSKSSLLEEPSGCKSQVKGPCLPPVE